MAPCDPLIVPALGLETRAVAARRRGNPVWKRHLPLATRAAAARQPVAREGSGTLPRNDARSGRLDVH